MSTKQQRARAPEDILMLTRWQLQIQKEEYFRKRTQEYAEHALGRLVVPEPTPKWL